MARSHATTLTSPESVARAILDGHAPEYLPVPGLTQALVRDSAAGLATFLKVVPRAEQDKWSVHVPRNPKFDEPDDGIIRRPESAGKKTDRKVLLQVRKDLPQLLAERGADLREPWATWIATCNEIRARCDRATLALAAAIDCERPELHLVERMRESEHVNPGVYRVGQYERGETGFAKAHVDRGCLTLHVGASHHGLYFNTSAGKAMAIAPEDGEALAFPGKMFEDLTCGDVRATVHGSDPLESLRPRWFGVYFAQIVE